MFPHSQIMVQRCPLCGGLMWGVPAISRVDNQTAICSDCGVRQALQSIGVDADEGEEILEIIHKHEGRG